MNYKIVKYITFAVAIIGILLACWFSYVAFDNDKKDSYFQVQKIEQQNPAMLADFQAATPENLPEVVAKYQKEMADYNKELNEKQLQKDILYTYLQDLKGLDEKNFEAYKANFPKRAEGLFARCDKKQEYVDGFNKVNTFKDLESYINKMDKEYTAMKQDYLVGREYYKAANSLIAKADMINASASATKKANDIQALKDDLKSFNSCASLQSWFVGIGYLLGIVTLLLMLWFGLVKMVKNIKTSYKLLIVLVAFVVVVFIGYLIGSPVLSPSALKFGMSVSGYKMVNAAAFTLYVCLLCAILAIIVTAVMSAIKNRK